MDKFQRLFYTKMRDSYDRFTSSNEPITQRDIYQFVHSIKGTAGTIGLPEWSTIAENLLADIREEDTKTWTSEEAARLLSIFVQLIPTQEAPQPKTEHPPLPVERKEESETDKPLILLVDDDLDLLMILKEVLEGQGWLVLATDDPDKGFAWFYEMRPDCVISDIVMKQSGFDFLQQIAPHMDVSLVPKVLMSGNIDKETRLRAYEAGVDDFIPKPIDLDEFIARVGRLLRKRKQVVKLLLLDELTGAYNTSFLHQQYELQRLSLAGEPFACCSLAVLDIDGFGAINERYGHQAGDRLLQWLAATIQSRLRKDELLARGFADQFLLWLPGRSENEATPFVQELQGLIADSVHEHPAGSFSVTVSAGVSAIAPDVSLDDNVHAVVSAMQDSKRPKRLNIAIVDDDALLRNVLSKQISDLEELNQIDIRCFEDGEHFFQDPWHAGRGKYLLILDRMMPRMNGAEVLGRIRADYPKRDYLIMMLTGVDDEREVAEAMRAGADDYLTKPFSLVELEARVRRLVRGMA
ncbi:response regulator [Paenibacillus oenotherae]|uniref:Response regulator n=1 Tax=Paenibacillus oenotherae TaxID=1435645 RepID=A0ABS7DAR5_9BACL|nr:response regulator [Paenibacillus oenotherae]MBW7476691.1 response regulator [Paenibacillus oenotherae]